MDEESEATRAAILDVVIGQPRVTVEFDAAVFLDVCVSDFFQGYSPHDGIVIATSVDAGTTWRDLRQGLIERYNCIDYADDHVNGEAAIRAMFDRIEADGKIDDPNDWRLDPIETDEDGEPIEDGADVYCYVALQYTEGTKRRIEDRDTEVYTKIAAIRTKPPAHAPSAE